jgi:hypothetical protein
MLLQAQLCMPVNSTSFLGYSMGLVGVVGTPPAVVTAVGIMHAKSGIFRPCFGCWCWHIQLGAGWCQGECIQLPSMDHVVHIDENAALPGSQVLQMLWWPCVTKFTGNRYFDQDFCPRLYRCTYFLPCHRQSSPVSYGWRPQTCAALLTRKAECQQHICSPTTLLHCSSPVSYGWRP